MNAGASAKSGNPVAIRRPEWRARRGGVPVNAG